MVNANQSAGTVEGTLIEPAAVVVYIIKTRVSNVEHRSERLHVAGFGQDTVFRTIPIGWFVHFEGSWEALYIGQEKPDLKAGDPIQIKIQRDPNANTNQAPIKQVREVPTSR